VPVMGATAMVPLPSAASPPTTARWDELPAELLETTLSLLPAEQIRAASQVSRHWRGGSEAPMKAACERAGLTLPAAGVRSWWGLQAHAERRDRNWRHPPWDRLPTHTIQQTPHDDRLRYYPNRSVKVSANGVHVSGKERMFISLPPVGSDAPVRFATLPPHAQEYPYGDYTGLANSPGYVLHSADSELIQLFLKLTDTVPAVAIKTKCVICAACSPEMLATGHKDGVRLWSLPDLALVGHISFTHRINGIGISSDSKCLVMEVVPGIQIWDLARRQCIQEIPGPVVSFFDDRRRDVLFRHFFPPRLQRYSFAGAFLRESVLPDYPGFGYLATPGLSIFHTGKELLTFDDLTGVFSLPLPPGHPWALRLPEVMTASEDGRWLIMLLDNGDVVLRDICSYLPAPGSIQSCAHERPVYPYL
jgi:hypothetical protein